MEKKTIPEQLTVVDILKMIWRTLILVGFLGLVLFIIFGTSYIDFEFFVVLVVIFEGLLILVRIFRLKERNQISRVNIFVSTVVGTLITSGATALFLFLFIFIGVSTGFLAQ